MHSPAWRVLGISAWGNRPFDAPRRVLARIARGALALVPGPLA